MMAGHRGVCTLILLSLFLFVFRGVNGAAENSDLPEPQVVHVNATLFKNHIEETRKTLVEFYAPWSSHSKRLAPEFEKAALLLKPSGVVLAAVDATMSKELSREYDFQDNPLLVWFEDGQRHAYDGEHTADSIVAWVNSMSGPAVMEVVWKPRGIEGKATMVFTGLSLPKAFEDAAKGNRRKVAWFHQKVSQRDSIMVVHRGEEPVELSQDMYNKTAIETFLATHRMPLVGRLDGVTFDHYMEVKKGLVCVLLANFQDNLPRYRPMFEEVAAKWRGLYFLTYTDTHKYKAELENWLGVEKFPAVVVQQKAGDINRYILYDELDSQRVNHFIQEVESGRARPSKRSEPDPTFVAEGEGPVRKVVGATLRREVFQYDKDVMLQVYAQWCAYCKKMDPEYTALAEDVVRYGLREFLSIASIDGVKNEPTVESMEWSNFPTIYFVKAGSSEPLVYDGERTRQAFWNFILRHGTNAVEISRRFRRKPSQKFDEL